MEKRRKKGRFKVLSQELHTVLSFDLPFMIPIPDRIYEVKTGNRVALISTKKIWREKVSGFSSSSGRVELLFDKYGLSGFTSIKIKFPWKMPETARAAGRQVALFVEPHISAPRNKNKETAIKFVNRLIEVTRIVYGHFYLRNVGYPDILSWKQSYWDGQKTILAGLVIFDHGCGGIRATAGKMSEEQARKEKEKLQDFLSILKNDTSISLEHIFLANAKDACIQEDFRIATLEGVTALEIVLYRFIRSRGKELRIPVRGLEDFIVKVGLTGNLRIVLRMLTEGLEQLDSRIVGSCSGAIRTRNKILHKGLRDIPAKETEKRVKNIEKMINYLSRVSTANTD